MDPPFAFAASLGSDFRLRGGCRPTGAFSCSSLAICSKPLWNLLWYPHGATRNNENSKIQRFNESADELFLPVSLGRNLYGTASLKVFEPTFLPRPLPIPNSFFPPLNTSQSVKVPDTFSLSADEHQLSSLIRMCNNSAAIDSPLHQQISTLSGRIIAAIWSENTAHFEGP